MINYRVDDMTGLLANLRAAGVEIVKGPDADESGHVRLDHRSGRQQSGAVAAQSSVTQSPTRHSRGALFATLSKG